MVIAGTLKAQHFRAKPNQARWLPIYRQWNYDRQSKPNGVHGTYLAERRWRSLRRVSRGALQGAAATRRCCCAAAATRPRAFRSPASCCRRACSEWHSAPRTPYSACAAAEVPPRALQTKHPSTTEPHITAVVVRKIFWVIDYDIRWGNSKTSGSSLWDAEISINLLDEMIFTYSITNKQCEQSCHLCCDLEIPR